MMHADQTHSPLGASQAHRWLKCPGSVRLQQEWIREHGKPESSVYALEGTTGHGIAAECLRSGCDAIEYVDGMAVDDSIIEGVQVYLDAIRNDQKVGGGKLLIETEFHLKRLHPLFYGTADCVRYASHYDNVMSVYDLKLGRGKIIEVLDGNGPNPQLAFYALGALDNIPESKNVEYIDLIVVQPRAPHRDGPVRRATFAVEEIVAMGSRLVEAALLCEQPEPALVPGDHCEFCAALPGCPAVRDFAFNAAQMDYAGRPVDPKAMNAPELAETLNTIEVIEAWITAVRAHAHLIAQTPDGIPGWKLVDKQGRRKWLDEKKARQELSVGFGLDLDQIFEQSMRSPAQIEKYLKPAERKLSAFKNLCPSVSSGTVLVRADNPRIERKPPDADYIGESDEW